MPDTLNKQAIVNLLIDSPLREPIKINLIDIVNNTNEPDLPKVYSTIVKELEIFQKATERRMKLADETIAKLNGTPSTQTAPTPEPSLPDFSAPQTPEPKLPDFSPTSGQSLPPLDLPPLPTSTPAPTPVAAPVAPAPVASAPVAPTTPIQAPVAQEAAVPAPGLTAATLDLPPVPQMPTLGTNPTAVPPVPNFQPLGGAAPSTTSDEDALAEIQKELDSLKSATASEISSAAAPAAAPTPAPQA